MKTLILGSGFGLYGYLPAAYKISNKIFLQKKYKNFFYSRSELKNFNNKIIWYDNLKAIINTIDIVIIAKRPIDQDIQIRKILNFKNKIKHFFLEKPLSSNYKRSFLLEKKIRNKGKSFSICFIFEYLSWHDEIKKIIKSNYNNIAINWFIKNKKKKDWKYQKKDGGGVIRFYGIHMIKLFSDLNFDNIVYNYFDKTHSKWILKIKDKKNNLITLKINSLSNKDLFKIDNNKKKIVNYTNPFKYKIIPNKRDPRVKYLKKYLLFNLKNKNKNKNDLQRFLNLWKNLEILKK